MHGSFDPGQWKMCFCQAAPSSLPEVAPLFTPPLAIETTTKMWFLQIRASFGFWRQRWRGIGSTRPVKTTSLHTSIRVWLSSNSGFSQPPSSQAQGLCAILTASPGRPTKRSVAGPGDVSETQQDLRFSLNQAATVSLWCPQPRPGRGRWWNVTFSLENLLSKGTHTTEGKGEMKQYEKKKKKTVLFTVCRCKMKLFW